VDKDSKVNDKVGYSNKEKIAKVPESAINALTTPLSLTGTPEEIDQSLAEALTQFVESHGRLQHTLDEATEQIAEAVRAAEERDKLRARRKAPAAEPRTRKKKRKQDQTNSCPFGAHPRTSRLTRVRTKRWWCNPSLIPSRNPFRMVNNPNSKSVSME